MIRNTRTLLVVDDNRANVTLYRQVLSLLGDVETICVTDPFEALRWCDTHEPALLVLDYRMPGMDGIQFMRHFRNLPGAQRVPIVMLTGIHSPVLWQMALDGGADEFLMKPIEKKHFLNRIHDLLLRTACAQ